MFYVFIRQTHWLYSISQNQTLVVNWGFMTSSKRSLSSSSENDNKSCDSHSYNRNTSCSLFIWTIAETIKVSCNCDWLSWGTSQIRDSAQNGGIYVSHATAGLLFSPHHLLLHGYRYSHPLELLHQCQRLLDVQVQDGVEPDRGAGVANHRGGEKCSADRVYFRSGHSSDDSQRHLPGSQWNYWPQVQDGTKV